MAILPSAEELAALRVRAGFVPQPGAQLATWTSKADLVLMGAGAGTGKTGLGLGMAAFGPHKRVLFMRRERSQCNVAIDELSGMLQSRDGWNGQDSTWRLPGGRVITFGGCQNAGDEMRYAGQPRDLLILDEAAAFLESQVRTLMAWVRSTDPGQRCRTLMTTNPPTSTEGLWLREMFAPWVDSGFPTPAQPGEIRWATTIDGRDQWCDGPEPFLHRGERITPTSRSFIPGRLSENRFLARTGYLQQLQAVPEPLRSILLHGSWTAADRPDAFAVIPPEWVKLAMSRWKPVPGGAPLTALGVDPSRGVDETIIARRSGYHFHELIAVPSHVAAHGGGIATAVLKVLGNSPAQVFVDCIGYGASAADHLSSWIGRQCVPVNFAAGSDERDLSGSFRFANERARAWWRLREMLDPSRGLPVALPRDSRLQADLTAPRYHLGSRGIQIEDKEALIRRLGHSPDRGDAVALCASRAVPIVDLRGGPGSVRAFRGFDR